MCDQSEVWENAGGETGAGAGQSSSKRSAQVMVLPVKPESDPGARQVEGWPQTPTAELSPVNRADPKGPLAGPSQSLRPQLFNQTPKRLYPGQRPGSQGVRFSFTPGRRLTRRTPQCNGDQPRVAVEIN